MIRLSHDGAQVVQFVWRVCIHVPYIYIYIKMIYVYNIYVYIYFFVCIFLSTKEGCKSMAQEWIPNTIELLSISTDSVVYL